MSLAKTNVRTAVDQVRFSEDNDPHNSITSGFNSTCSNPVICMYRMVFHFFTIFEFQNAWGPYRWYFG